MLLSLRVETSIGRKCRNGQRWRSRTHHCFGQPRGWRVAYQPLRCVLWPDSALGKTMHACIVTDLVQRMQMHSSKWLVTGVVFSSVGQLKSQSDPTVIWQAVAIWICGRPRKAPHIAATCALFFVIAHRNATDLVNSKLNRQLTWHTMLLRATGRTTGTCPSWQPPLCSVVVHVSHGSPNSERYYEDQIDDLNDQSPTPLSCPLSRHNTCSFSFPALVRRRMRSHELLSCHLTGYSLDIGPADDASGRLM